MPHATIVGQRKVVGYRFDALAYRHYTEEDGSVVSEPMASEHIITLSTISKDEADLLAQRFTRYLLQDDRGSYDCCEVTPVFEQEGG